ncbi:uncharacterized protein LOC113338565 [Papaver somniferum]|uniref:uncharacterized protein LOC113338565 n=1 Tax=Papaver somniferum TaxID=3469 RepID=UPI000E6F9FB8|nr:uncharacterized protein LOC113338565 [Papaver somniferum]
MTQAPFLALPDFNKPFTLDTDACSRGVGALLLQENMPITFFSKPLGPKALALSTYEKEFLAIVMAVQKWKHYLGHNQFVINTDHQSLKYLMEQKLSSAFLQKWLVKLMGFDYVIRYKKSKDNQVVDELSRLPHASCFSLSLYQPQWSSDIISSYDSDTVAQNLITQLLISPTLQHYTYLQGILRFKGRLYIGSGNAIRSSILQSVHSSVVGGHSGIACNNHRLPKLDFSHLYGINPRGWLQKSERYFQLNDIEEHKKVDIAAIYLEGKAEKWFLNFQVNRPRITWTDLSKHLCARFENPIEENFVGSFNKLVQTNRVDEYYEEFESLKALMLDMNPTLIETYFVMSIPSFLKDEIGKYVSMFPPQTLAAAFSLARLQEQKLSSVTHLPKSYTKPFNSPFISNKQFQFKNFSHRPAPTSPKSAPMTLKSSFHNHSKPTPTTTTIKKLTQEEMKKIRAQGLCYNCDEVYRKGHFCKGKKKIFMLQVENSESQETEEEEDIFEEAVDSPVRPDLDISLHALNGNATGDTIRIPGVLNNHKVSILIDSGSTTSFIDSALATSLQCNIDSTAPMKVTVANGEYTLIHGICTQLQWSMHVHTFVENLRLLPLGGCDIVLGADWFKTLGDVLFNFSKPSISFKYKGKKITLQGVGKQTSLLQMSGEVVNKFLSSSSHGLLGHLFSISTPTSPPTTPDILLPLLHEFDDIFQEPTQLPPQRNLDHKIPLQPNLAPINLRDYKCPYIKKGVVEQLVQEMLKSTIIQPSNSPFASPILLLKNKYNTWRFCVDYRKLNSIKVKDKFPIPIIEELLDELNRAIVFTRIDLRDGYHQIRVHLSDIFKTAFRTLQGHYEFKVMPFGLTNSPATFEALMNEIFQPALRKFILVFFDDIIIYNKRMTEHLEHLSWPTPSILKELRGFLGLTGYDKKFVRNYGAISKPLTDLLKKNSFNWTSAATSAFEQLKQAMSTTPILVLPDFTKPFVVESDASDSCIGAVLLQDGKPIAYFSKPLGPGARALSTYEKEFLAIVLAVQIWRHYLQGAKITTPLQQRYLIKLLGFDYVVRYKKEVENIVADALSRRPPDSAHCNLLAASTPAWAQEVLSSDTGDEKAQGIISKLLLSPSSVENFTYKEGILRYQTKLYIGTGGTNRQALLHSLHNSVMGGHSGIQATYARAKAHFYWQGLKKDVLLFVYEYDECQRNKSDTTSSAGLLQPLPIPDYAWKHITMDFVDGIPTSNKKNVILVVVYRITKYAHFIALHHPYSASSVAQVFLNHIFKLHGLPASIVSDRDKVFTGNFWTYLFKSLGTSLNLSSAYHPQTVGQTERVNACLENYLRCVSCHKPSSWRNWLFLAKWWYNTSFHRGLKMSPFQALYVYLPPHLAFPSNATTSVDAVEAYLKSRDTMLDIIKESLHQA